MIFTFIYSAIFAQDIVGANYSEADPNVVPSKSMPNLRVLSLGRILEFNNISE